MMSSTMVIRRAGTCDLEAVLAIQQQAYPLAFHEARAAFEAKLARPHAALWLAYVNEAPCAYLLGFGCSWCELPQLGSDTYIAAGAAAQFWYWHDLAVSPAAQGLGLSKKLLQQGQTHAEQVASEAYLIAVDGAASFWQRAGFEFTTAPADAVTKLNSYGDDAVLMRRAF